MTVQLIQFCPSLQLLQSFFQKIALKGYLTQRWIAITVSILQKNFLTKCRPPKQPKNVKFSLWSVIETFPREMHDFSGEVQKFSREVQNDLSGGAHLSTPPLKMRPWVNFRNIEAYRNKQIKPRISMSFIWIKYYKTTAYNEKINIFNCLLTIVCCTIVLMKTCLYLNRSFVRLMIRLV
jgi:hypothetical protein